MTMSERSSPVGSGRAAADGQRVAAGAGVAAPGDGIAR